MHLLYANKSPPPHSTYPLATKYLLSLFKLEIRDFFQRNYVFY